MKCGKRQINDLTKQEKYQIFYLSKNGVSQKNNICHHYNISVSTIRSCEMFVMADILENEFPDQYLSSEEYKNLTRKPFEKSLEINHKNHPYYKKLINFTENRPTFTVQDIIDKFGETPICYLTGETIKDIYDTGSYHFDHIMPKIKGGPSTLDNLGICLGWANMMKSIYQLDDFLSKCKMIYRFSGQ